MSEIKSSVSTKFILKSQTSLSLSLSISYSFSLSLSLRATWDPPLQTNLSDGTKLFTTGLPGSGALLAFILNVFENYGFTASNMADFNATTLTYHRMIETFKYAYAFRANLGDGRYVDMTKVSATRLDNIRQ